MDFSLSPELEALRQKTGAFVKEHCIPLESPRESFDEHENIPLEKLAILRDKAKAVGLWAPQMPKELGGMGLTMAEQAVIYEEANYSIFGPAALNCSALVHSGVCHETRRGRTKVDAKCAGGSYDIAVCERVRLAAVDEVLND
ncbi:MAG: acyl-CoA/acyl-ACP dehydrogenase, partial [Rhodospirillaceae bacterium]|nr:acyl-CoA/acyl-ACP dehydrogenase [Rhodospirillaceae bacterium]